MPHEAPPLDELVDVLVAAFPEFAEAEFRLLNAGWDSVAVDVDGVWICKFPRHVEGAERLRREAAVLQTIGAAVSLAVPRLELYETPRLFSRHRKIPGEHLMSADYDLLSEPQRAELGVTLGQFYAELHGIPAGTFEALGAQPLEPWLPPAEIMETCWPLLDVEQRRFAKVTIEGWASLLPDPYGTIFGYFDGHGWNMAFDHGAGRLMGVYDFADSGFAPLHQEFLYASMVSPDLTRRIVDTYEQVTGRSLDRRRIGLITGAHRLWELAVEARNPAAVPQMLAAVEKWRTSATAIG